MISQNNVNELSNLGKKCRQESGICIVNLTSQICEVIYPSCADIKEQI